MNMTVKEVAEILDVSDETVRANGKKIFPELFKNGIRTDLNEVQVTAIKLEIQKHHNLQSSLELGKVKTKLEKHLLIKQALSLQDELIQDLEKELSEAKPKIEMYDLAMSSNDTIAMNDVCKILNLKIGRNEMFKILRDKNVLDRNNRPYQHYVNKGYFKVIENPYTTDDGRIFINLKTVVYQKGIEFILKLITKNEEEQKLLTTREPRLPRTMM